MNPDAPIHPVYRKEGVKIFEANGITIRNYIAIEAMKALINNYGNFADANIRQILTILSYEYADTLIAQSNKK